MDFSISYLGTMTAGFTRCQHRHIGKTEIVPFRSLKNQRVENAGVAFVKGASERNKFFEKINNQ